MGFSGGLLGSGDVAARVVAFVLGLYRTDLVLGLGHESATAISVSTVVASGVEYVYLRSALSLHMDMGDASSEATDTESSELMSCPMLAVWQSDSKKLLCGGMMERQVGEDYRQRRISNSMSSSVSPRIG